MLQTEGFTSGLWGNNSVATFNFTGGTLQANPVYGMSLGLPVDLTQATGMCRIDMNGQAVSFGTLLTQGPLTDLNFATPGAGSELLTVSSITVNPNTAITLGAAPSV